MGFTRNFNSGLSPTRSRYCFPQIPQIFAELTRAFCVNLRDLREIMSRTRPADRADLRRISSFLSLCPPCPLRVLCDPALSIAKVRHRRFTTKTKDTTKSHPKFI